MDTDFNKLDFNACPVAIGNPGPSYLSGVDRCKTKTTMCKHKMNYGFRRGAYVCICRPGFRYPSYISPPYQGEDIERATSQEYEEGFQCTRVDWPQVLPNVELDRNIIMGKISRIHQSYLADPVNSRMLKSLNGSEDVYGPQQRYAGRYMPNNFKVASLGSTTSSVGNYQIVETHKLVYKILDTGFGSVSLASTSRVRRKRSVFDQTVKNRMERIFRHKSSISSTNCHLRRKTDLYLPGDVAYGVDSQFEAEARTALRLSHFLSIYLQNVNYNESLGDLKGGDRLHFDHLFGEVIANVMSNYRIESSGVFFEKNMFENMDGSSRDLFGPYAYRTSGGGYNALDLAGLSGSYTDQEWFQKTKERWSTNTEGLITYKMRPYVRSDHNGTSQTRFEYFPISYKAPRLQDGRWTRPHFKCDERTNSWVMTFAVPFFGKTRLGFKLQFKGVITVDVKLDNLDIYQCPQPFYVANAFKNTARCDGISTKCLQIKGLRFVPGGYRCNCARGYEYPHRDKKMWIEGQLLENEYQKKVKGFFSRFDDLKCRVSGSRAVVVSNLWLASLLMALL